MEKILEIIENDNRITPKEIAVMLNRDVKEVEQAIKKMEDDKIILSYKTLINWQKTEKEIVSAIIELCVTPQRGEGFDKVAKRIYKYPQVKSVYLMSGGYDLGVVIDGKTMKEVAMFVAEKLAPMESVLSTRTHFVLKKYKDEGVIFDDDEKDDRVVITL